MKSIHKTTLFLILTFSLSFSLVGIFKLVGGNYHDKISSLILALAYMFVPMICAIIVQHFIHREPLKTPFQISFAFNKWFILAWILPPILAFITFGINLLFPDVTYSPDMQGMIKKFGDTLTPEQLAKMKKTMESLPIPVIWITLLQGLIAGISVNALAAFGEELGWRGFLVDAWKHFSFAKASILIGFIWGIWHAPLILMGHNYPEHPELGVLFMTIWCMLLSPLFLYITIKSKSVIAASILHGTINATGSLSIMLIDGGSDLTVGATGLAGIVTMLIINFLLIFYDNVISKEKILSAPLQQFM